MLERANIGAIPNGLVPEVAKRARQLDRSERLDAETRPQHVRDVDSMKI